MREALLDTNICFITDSLSKYNLYHNKGNVCVSVNADLFIELYKLITQKNIEFELKWMPSHLKTDETKRASKASWVTDFELEGNDLADKLADVAATKFQHKTCDTAHYIKYRKLVGDIQRRLLAILLTLPNRPSLLKNKALSTPKLSADRRALMNGHDAYISNH